MVLFISSAAMSCSIAALSGMDLTIGQFQIIGSPSKYIWVINLCAKPWPNTVVGDGPAAPAEIGIERRKISLALVPIASTCIGLPEFQECTRNTLAAFVYNSAANNNALPDRALAGLRIIVDKIGVELAQH